MTGSSINLRRCWTRPCAWNERWKRVAEGSESAVDAGALPAQSKAVRGHARAWGVLECGGKRSATPLWLMLRRQVSRKRVAEGSESAVDADALPAQSKAAVGRREPGAFWSAAGSGSATPLWFTWRRQVSWKRVAEGSESAVVAGALPAQSKIAVGVREPGVFWSAAGSEAPRRFGLRCRAQSAGSGLRKEVKAPSSLALCRRSPKQPWACESRGSFGVRREAKRHAALAYVEETSQPEAGCGRK